MAAEFLVMLYEYSPLFYITVISVCFIITVAAVLGWFGFDVPVILRSSDETESLIPVPERKMVQVTNPFALEMDSTAGTVTEGVSLRPYCLEDCVLSCFWGCGVQALQAALQSHQHGLRLSTSELFQEALQLSYLHHQSFKNEDIFDEIRELFERHIDSNTTTTFKVQKERRKRRILHPDATRFQNNRFWVAPRDRYPLVAVLTLANLETRDNYNIVASVTVLHVPDDKYRLSARILFQYLLTAHGNFYDLKPLFMSADNSNLSGSTEPSTSTQDAEPQPEMPGEKREESDSDEEWPDTEGKDCVVCQNAPTNRVLLPCRHACVCDGCVCRFQHCPICRAFVLESFALSNRPTCDIEEEDLTED